MTHAVLAVILLFLCAACRTTAQIGITPWTTGIATVFGTAAVRSDAHTPPRICGAARCSPYAALWCRIFLTPAG